jgi:hypothetical protein
MAIGAAILVLALPWALVFGLSRSGAASHYYVLALLSEGGPRGRTIDGILYAIPTVAAGFATARIGGVTPLSRFTLLLLLTSSFAFASMLGLRVATAGWDVKLLPAGGASVGRAAQALFFVGAGSLLGHVAREARKQKGEPDVTSKTSSRFMPGPHGSR